MVARRPPNPMTGWPGPEYRVRMTFRAPLEFVYRWCTDYTREDAKLEGEQYERRIVERSARRVVFEDLEGTPTGWQWSRSAVTLLPPNAWHLQGRGNWSEWAGTYTLSERPDGRVELDLRWRRRDLHGARRPMTKAERERGSTIAWQRFARALERDYRHEHHSRR